MEVKFSPEKRGQARCKNCEVDKIPGEEGGNACKGRGMACTRAALMQDGDIAILKNRRGTQSCVRSERGTVKKEEGECELGGDGGVRKDEAAGLCERRAGRREECRERGVKNWAARA